MNVMPLESRRERTQPRRVMSLPTGELKACLTEVNCPGIQRKYRLTPDNVNQVDSNWREKPIPAF
jgi:hypothetical protein